MMHLGKRAFIDRFAEALVAVIFGFLLVLLIFMFKGSVEQAKTLEVSDLQDLEIGSVYASTFGKVDYPLLQALDFEMSALDLYYWTNFEASQKRGANVFHSVLREDFAEKVDVVTWRLIGSDKQDTFMFVPYKGELYLISPFNEYFMPATDPHTGFTILGNRYTCTALYDEQCYVYKGVLGS